MEYFMKSSLIFLLFFLSGFLLFSHSVTIVVTGLDEVKGQVSIALYNSPDDFPEEENVFQGVNVKVKDKTVRYTFTDIPAGIYAIALMHDKNMNEKMDKSLLGIPKEGYAFSNNVFGTFGPPDYEQVAFEVKGDTTLEISVKYH
jgi:uncharacterized protein (DUF2141 family)